MEQIGRYNVVKEVGRGALGTVYMAADPLIGRTVAIKTIQISASRTDQSRDELRQRLYREAQSAGVLSHSTIVTIHDMGEQGDEAYIVMEFVEGTTLEKIFSSDARQHTGFFLDIIRKTADALDYAHARGIIHRDIKPSNLMVCPDGSVKITDFGIAKISQSTGLTHTGIVVGTPNYMSPEQAQGRQVDGRSDQFSLAVVAFQMLARKLPFDGPSLTAVLSKILWEEPDYMGTNLHEDVQAVLQKGLSKNPYLRYTSCSEFARDLQQACDRQHAELPATGTTADAAAMEAESVAQTVIGEALTSEVEIPTRSGGYHAAEPAELSSGTADYCTQDVPANSKPARRGVVIAAAVLLVVVAVIATLMTGRRNGQSSQSDTVARSAAVSKTGIDTPVQDRPGAANPEARPSEPTQLPAPQIHEATKAAGAVLSKRNPAETATSTLPPARAAAVGSQHAPATGTISWSGRLAKNSILVITNSGPSYGTAVGAFPGVPVKVEVEPPTLQIRESPGPSNGWSRLMLYTGREKCSAITIRWTMIK